MSEEQEAIGSEHIEQWVEEMTKKMEAFLREGEKSMIITGEDLNTMLD